MTRSHPDASPRNRPGAATTNRLPVLVLVAAVAFAASPILFPGFAGYDPALFPVMHDDPAVQPAGWAFAIWGPIYLWLIAGAAFGLWRRARSDDWAMMRGPLLGSLGIGFFWLPVAARLPGLATLMILAMLVLAVVAMLWSGRQDRWWQVRPVALYAGWLTAASGVSVGIWLGGHGWLHPQVAAIVCLVAVCLAALGIQSMRPREWAYPAAIIWALAGVIAANWAAGNAPVIAIAAIGAVVLALRPLTALRKDAS